MWQTTGRWSLREDSGEEGNLVVEDDIEEGAVDVEPAVVVNQAHLFEPIHEETDARARGPDHCGKCFLTNLRNDLLWFTFLPEMSHEQQDPGQPLLAGIEELIDQILLDANVPSQHIGKEQRGEGAVVFEQSEHRLFVDADENGVFDSRRRGQMHRLPGETPFPEKAAWLQYHDDGFFTLWRDHTQHDFPRLDIEYGIRRISLREESLLLRRLQRRFAIANLLEEGLWIKRRHRYDSHGQLCS